MGKQSEEQQKYGEAVSMCLCVIIVSSYANTPLSPSVTFSPKTLEEVTVATSEAEGGG